MRTNSIIGLLLFMAVAVFVVVGCNRSGGEKTTSSPAPVPAPVTVEKTAIATPETGILAGTVKYKGEPPAMQPSIIDPKHNDAGYCLKGDPIDKQEQKWIVGKDNMVANVVVFVEPAADKKFAPSDKVKDLFKKNAAVIDQPYCAFRQHVVGVYANFQPLLVKNSAKVLHNVKITPGALDPSVNQRIESGSELLVKPFKTVGAIRVECDMHNWMNAQIYSLNHPYFAVTKEDGTFKIENVPIDTELTVWTWHEATNKVEQKKMKVAAGENALALEIAAK
jgi:hypothetical protein